jgi:hypothetical protein
MTEIINILKEEPKYDGLEGHKFNSSSGSAKMTSYNNTQCRNCVKLQNKLKETTNNPSSMTLISEILSEEIRVIKQETHVASNNINNDQRWQSVKQTTRVILIVLCLPGKGKYLMEYRIHNTTWSRSKIDIQFSQDSRTN